MHILATIAPHFQIDQYEQLYDRVIAYLTFEHKVSILFVGDEIHPSILRERALLKRMNGLCLYGAQYFAQHNSHVAHLAELDFHIQITSVEQLLKLKHQADIIF